MRVLSVVLLCAFACSLGYAPELKAADAKMYSTAKHGKRSLRVAYVPCRTGWWRTSCNGMMRPRWGTRCRN
jgi:hypothetical protein